MPDYRLFHRDQNGHIAGAIEFDADTDHEAIQVAAEKRGTWPTVDVWQESRFVARVTSAGPLKPMALATAGQNQ
jgi:hypothetical protein